jgi:hypothetical protein
MKENMPHAMRMLGWLRSPAFHLRYVRSAIHPGMVRKKKKAKTMPETAKNFRQPLGPSVAPSGHLSKRRFPCAGGGLSHAGIKLLTCGDIVMVHGRRLP